MLQLVGSGCGAGTPEFRLKPKALIIGRLESPRGAKTKEEECPNELSDGAVPTTRQSGSVLNIRPVPMDLFITLGYSPTSMIRFF